MDLYKDNVKNAGFFFFFNNMDEVRLNYGYFLYF